MDCFACSCNSINVSSIMPCYKPFFSTITLAKHAFHLVFFRYSISFWGTGSLYSFAAISDRSQESQSTPDYFSTWTRISVSFISVSLMCFINTLNTVAYASTLASWNTDKVFAVNFPFFLINDLANRVGFFLTHSGTYDDYPFLKLPNHSNPKCNGWFRPALIMLLRSVNSNLFFSGSNCSHCIGKNTVLML